MILTNIAGTLVTLQTIQRLVTITHPFTLKNQSYITISNNALGREAGVYNCRLWKPFDCKGKHYILTFAIILLSFC